MRTIDERIGPLKDRIGAAIFFGNSYNYDGKPWSVALEYKHDGIEVKTAGRAVNLDLAFDQAWNAMEKLITRGLGASAMMPALEAPKAPPPQAALFTGIDADDIPF